MNPSRARIDASRGKSAKLVWAANTRIPIVEMRRTYQAGPWPKVARPTCESTDSVADGRAPAVVARKEMPRKTKPRITAIITIVAWAFFHSGGLNAGVPFEMASVPVIALQPSANARIRRSRLMDSTGTSIGTTPVTSGGWPEGGADHADDDEDHDAHHEDVGRQGEDRAALADAAEVHGHHEEDRGDDQRNGEGVQEQGRPRRG